MLNFIGFRICANSICKKALVHFRYMRSDNMVLQSQQICSGNFIRNYIIYHSLFNKKLDHCESNKESGTVLKKKYVPKEQKVSVIKPNDEEMVMSIKDAEAHAKRLNMKLVPHNSSRGDKKKYKLVKVSELFGDKVNSGDTKRVCFRQEIDIHDLNVKIRQYIKMVLKGHRIVCMVDGKDKNKLDNVVKVIEQSDLNNYLTNVTKTSTGLNLIFQVTKKNIAPTESKEELKAL